MLACMPVVDVSPLMCANTQLCEQVDALKNENTSLRMQLNSALHELHLVKFTEADKSSACASTQTTTKVVDCASQTTTKVVDCGVQCAPLVKTRDACVDTYSSETAVVEQPSISSNSAEVEQKMWLLATTFTAHPNLQRYRVLLC